MWSEEYRLSLIGQMTRKLNERLYQTGPDIVYETVRRINMIALQSDNVLENEKRYIMLGSRSDSIRLEEPEPNFG